MKKNGIKLFLADGDGLSRLYAGETPRHILCATRFFKGDSSSSSPTTVTNAQVGAAGKGTAGGSGSTVIGTGSSYSPTYIGGTGNTVKYSNADASVATAAINGANKFAANALNLLTNAFTTFTSPQSSPAVGAVAGSGVLTASAGSPASAIASQSGATPSAGVSPDGNLSTYPLGLTGTEWAGIAVVGGIIVLALIWKK